MNRLPTNSRLILVLISMLSLSTGCKEQAVPDVPTEPKERLVIDSGSYTNIQGQLAEKRLDYSERREPCAVYNPFRNPYVGDLHVHTERSLDAGIQDTRTSPAQAYQFAKGQPLGIQPWTSEGEALRSVHLETPLDFAMVSDHAEFFGETHLCNDVSNPNAYDSQECAEFREDPRAKFVNWNLRYLGGIMQPDGALSRFEFCGEGAKDCLDKAASVWQEMIDAAEAAYDKTSQCEFTALVGYEYTGAPLSFNLHRNVVFKNSDVPGQPLSYIEYPRPENLWAALEENCNDKNNCEALTIPHNSNMSGDFIFHRAKGVLGYSDYDENYVRLRNKYEPLIEIFQHKGDSECDRSADEFCGFEKFPFNNLIADRYAGFLSGEPSSNSFVRTALKDGLKLEDRYGINPFKYGVIASTDTHLGTPGLVEESDYPGHGGAGADNGSEVVDGLKDLISFGPGGLAILWAEENSRDYLFDAMQRKEAQGTSGPRILLRMFAGWDLQESEICNGFGFDENALSLKYGAFVRVGDSQGVPMGGDLSGSNNQGGAPTIAIGALKDASAEAKGLAHLQIVKGWVDGQGNTHEKTYIIYSDRVKPSSDLGLDLNSCQVTQQSQSALCQVWTDPDFNPAHKAFYYARAIEQPTCRWSWQQCTDLYPENPLEKFSEACKDPTQIPEGYRDCCLHEPVANNYPNHLRKEQIGTYPPVIQERAWSSPIWYKP
ncbi:MAG: DUF3604 domain-containing protein [Pseudomonadales bacterium]|nr:DUF3604 domain-containing protein [Pseudomonadales bacterium]